MNEPTAEEHAERVRRDGDIFYCSRCGERWTPELSMNVNTWLAMRHEFIEKHKGCKVSPMHGNQQTAHERVLAIADQIKAGDFGVGDDLDPFHLGVRLDASVADMRDEYREASDAGE